MTSVRPVPLPPDEAGLSAADLWDYKVKQGLSPDSATKYVSTFHGAPPSLAPSDATSVTPNANYTGILPNLAKGVGHALMAPIRSAVTANRAAAEQDAANAIGMTGGDPSIVERTVSPVEARDASLQTLANLAAPGLARLGLGGRLLGNAAIGASYDPDHPLVGAGLGAATGEVVHGVGTVARKAGGAALDMAGARPVSYEGVPTLTNLAAQATSPARQFIGRLFQDPSEGLGADIGRNANAATQARLDAMRADLPTIYGKTEPAPATASPSTLTRSNVMKATARALGVQSREQQVTGMLSNAARASGITPQQAEQVPVQSPSTALDLAEPGSPLHRLVRQAYNVPTSTAQSNLRSFFADRAAGTGDRIQNALTDATGATPTDTDLPVEARIEQRAQEAKPLYAKAYEYGPIKDPQTIQQIQTLLKNPTFAKAWARGKTLMDLDGETGPTTNGEPLSPENAAQLKKMGIELPQTQQQGPTVQQIDYWKKGLDAQIESGAGSENALSRTEAYKYRQKLGGILKRVDAEVPDYAAARQNFAGHSDLLEASQAGADHFSPSTSASYLQRTLPERFPTPGEQQEYNANAINAFTQKVRNLAANPDLPGSARGTNIVQRLMGTADAGAKLRMLFPDDASYQGFIRQMEQEAQYPKTTGFFTNQSSTAGQLAESGTNPKVWLDAAMSPFSNHARLRLLSRAIDNATSSKMAPETANLIGQQATETGPPLYNILSTNRYAKKLTGGSLGRTAARGAAQNDPFQR